MQFEMLMPKMGESIMDGTILKWIKTVGDMVEKDEIILEISTDKVDSEIPTPVPGKIVKIIAQEGDTIDVGLPIALIETESDIAIDEPIKKEESSSSAVGEVIPAETPDSRAAKKIAKTSGTRFYSPVVMNIANKNNISFADIESIPGTGLNGRVTKKDIVKFIETNQGGQTTHTEQTEQFVGSDGVEIIKMDHVRKSIARHMIASKQTSAHVSIYAEVDMNNISIIRECHKKTFKANEGFSLTYMPFIAEATVRALKEFPMLNASIDGENILVKHFVNLGVAVAVDNGLLVPNIFNADERNIIGLSRAVNDLALRARTKKLKPDELSGGTFSISNFGVYGTTIGFPIINQPQVAILGVGAVKKRPVVINDAIAIRPILYVSLTFDHRLIDGAMGAQFLQKITRLLEDYDPDMKL